MKDIIMMPIGNVKPYANNPRNNKDAVAKVAASLREFGFRQPIVVDKDNVVIAGHTRLLAAKKLKMKEVPVLVADDLSEEQVRAYRLADNKTAEFALWDEDKLSEELSAILDIDMEDFGFDLDLNLDEEEEEAVDDDFEPELPEEPTAKYGDVYQLGNHRLMCGDSTKPEDVEKLCDGKRVDMLLTDPPYNVDYEGTAGKIKNDSMSDTVFRTFLSEAFLAAQNVMEPGAAFYIWHADSEGYNFRGACHDVGLQVRQCLIWMKNSLVMGRQDYQWRHEPCLYGWKDGASHKWKSDRKQTTILEYDKPKKNDVHPTMKPVPLFDYLIKNSSEKGDVVLDLFGGSGTTIIACEQNGRHGYCMELDPRFVDVIIKRWETFTNGTAELISRGDEQ